LNPLTREFRARVAAARAEPTEKMAEQAKDAAERFTFNKELGEKGQAMQNFVRAWHLEWLLPFIRTPSNIMKELARMTPFAPLVKEWRDAIARAASRATRPSPRWAWACRSCRSSSRRRWRARSPARASPTRASSAWRRPRAGSRTA
jgi:hypothetical protein